VPHAIASAPFRVTTGRAAAPATESRGVGRAASGPARLSHTRGVHHRGQPPRAQPRDSVPLPPLYGQLLANGWQLASDRLPGEREGRSALPLGAHPWSAPSHQQRVGAPPLPALSGSVVCDAAETRTAWPSQPRGLAVAGPTVPRLVLCSDLVQPPAAHYSVGQHGQMV